MSHLKPEIRADKDGKLVTRHVRVDAPASTPAKPIPAPVAPAVAKEESQDFIEVNAMLRNLVTHYRALAADNEDRSDDLDPDDDEDDFWRMDDGEEHAEIGFDPQALADPDGITSVLSKLPQRTLTCIREKSESIPYSDDYDIALLHAISFEEDRVPEFLEYMTYYYNDLSSLYPEDEDMLSDPDANSYTLARKHVNILRSFEPFGYTLPESIYEASEDDHSMIYALTFLRAELGEDDQVDEGLVRLVLDRPQDVDRIVDIVGSRGTRDEAVIRSILESETPSLSNGLL
jgi:hypothetical protein